MVAASEDDTDYGRSVGVNGTPATFINGEIVEGVNQADPFASFKNVIEKYLK